MLFQGSQLSFKDKLKLPQSLRDVMDASEFKAIKQLGAIKRHLFLRSVIKAKVERLRQRSQMESRMNQKALRAKKKESFMKPSLQNVLTVDLVNIFVCVCACVRACVRVCVCANICGNVCLVVTIIPTHGKLNGVFNHYDTDDTNTLLIRRN